VRNGAMHNALLAASLVLTPAAEGDGGFAIVPGSHIAHKLLSGCFSNGSSATPYQ